MNEFVAALWHTARAARTLARGLGRIDTRIGRWSASRRWMHASCPCLRQPPMDSDPAARASALALCTASLSAVLQSDGERYVNALVDAQGGPHAVAPNDSDVAAVLPGTVRDVIQASLVLASDAGPECGCALQLLAALSFHPQHCAQLQSACGSARLRGLAASRWTQRRMFLQWWLGCCRLPTQSWRQRYGTRHAAAAMANHARGRLCRCCATHLLRRSEAPWWRHL